MDIFLDIKKKVNIEIVKSHLLNDSINTYYSFSPYSSYIYEQLEIKYIPLTEIYTAIDYKNDTINLKKIFFERYPGLKYYKYIFSLFFAIIIQDNKKFKLIKSKKTYLYITDNILEYQDLNDLKNNISNIFIKFLDINKVILIDKIKQKSKINKLTNMKNKFKKLFILIQSYFNNIFLFNYSVSSFTYDIIHINLKNFIHINNIIRTTLISNKTNLYDDIVFFNKDEYDLCNTYNALLRIELNKLLNSNQSIEILNKDRINLVNINSLGSELSEYYIKKELYQSKKITFSYQHGSYLYHTYTDNYNIEDLYEVEIQNTSINFVFNDYTKKLFDKLGAKKVYSVGSILFNKPIKEKKKKYDFLYITQGHDYMGNLQYVDFRDSLHSFDGYELYQRHKNIIELFGSKFKDKKILIRVHPCVVTTGVYVPFWELAEQYPNITIDVSIPIHNLIEKSKYIISDYFTTEFINRELHYKRDIILFQGAPTPLPKETIEDMDKMFILIDTIDDLKEKVENIEAITKNRKRYDDIIEYYSSKKCDTKKVVTEILEKEFNARI